MHSFVPKALQLVIARAQCGVGDIPAAAESLWC
jgi:hypothetical protein